jgi:lysine-N-methylase
MEIGVGLCCEEAARLILSDPAPAEFETYLTDADPDDEEGEDAPLYLPLLSLRERLFALLQNRTLPLKERMAQALRLAAAIQDQINRGEVPAEDTPFSETQAVPCDVKTVLAAAVDVHAEMEYLEQEWMDSIHDLREHMEELDFPGFFAALGERRYEYEHVLVYLVFRYFLKAVYDENALVKIQQAILMVLTMGALGCRVWQKTGRFSLADQIEVTRQYSKEVEYSDDNMELLSEGFLFEPGLDIRHLLGWLEG